MAPPSINLLCRTRSSVTSSFSWKAVATLHCRDHTLCTLMYAADHQGDTLLFTHSDYFSYKDGIVFSKTISWNWNERLIIIIVILIITCLLVLSSGINAPIELRTTELFGLIKKKKSSLYIYTLNCVKNTKYYGRRGEKKADKKLTIWDKTKSTSLVIPNKLEIYIRATATVSLHGE